MKSIDVLVCTIDKGIVRVADILVPYMENVHYVVSFQYTDERYLDLIPKKLLQRSDVIFIKHRGQGLSANRNKALNCAISDYVIFADDDARFTPESFSLITRTFEQHPEVDVALFQASTYTGKSLKKYPEEEYLYPDRPSNLHISVLEMACRREKIQGVLAFDERFGLGTDYLTCGEEEIWLEDASRLGLVIRYFPQKLVETSTMLKQRLLYIDPGVQRSRGAIMYYRYGARAWWICFWYALKLAMRGFVHFFPFLRHLAEGIFYMQRTQR